MGIAVRIGAVVCGLALCGAAPAQAVETPQTFGDLAARCAPSVHPATLAAVVRQESRFNPLAIGVNGSPSVRVKAQTVEEAVKTAERLISQGRSIDLGLGQINSANLEWLGLSVRDAFDPCLNLRAAGRVLTENFMRYRDDARSDQAALDAALSAYNTGNRTGGLRNGYVAKVRGGQGRARAASWSQPTTTAAPPPAWDAFGGPGPGPSAAWDAFAAQPAGQGGAAIHQGGQ